MRHHQNEVPGHSAASTDGTSDHPPSITDAFQLGDTQLNAIKTLTELFHKNLKPRKLQHPHRCPLLVKASINSNLHLLLLLPLQPLQPIITSIAFHTSFQPMPPHLQGCAYSQKAQQDTTYACTQYMNHRNVCVQLREKYSCVMRSQTQTPEKTCNISNYLRA